MKLRDEFLLVLMAAFFLFACFAEAADPPHSPSIVLSNSAGEDIGKKSILEPSGICYHVERDSLFVVGDEGDIYELTTTGALLRDWHIRDADFEGVTHDPATGLLYIAVEGEEKILEVSPKTFQVLREFPIERTFEGKLLMKAKGQGIEAITFAPDDAHPHGGTFFVANQAFRLDDANDVSGIFELEVPLKGGATESKATILNYIPMQVIDLSGLHYDPASDHLFVISDATNALFEMDRSGKIVNAYALPGDDQEGITLQDSGFLYIAQDSGGVIKIEWRPQR